MSSQTPVPPSAGQGLGSSLQPLQTSAQASLDPGRSDTQSPLGRVQGGALPASTEQTSLAAPGAQGVGAPSNAVDGVERSSVKRSFGDRRRDASTSSKRSNRQVTNEKSSQPSGLAGAQASSQPKPKKKGFLSFLSCCSGPDDSTELGSSESAQPSKTPALVQPSRAKQPQASSQAPNASATNTSADASKEVIDEKAGQAPASNTAPVIAAAIPTTASDPEKQIYPQSQPPPAIPTTTAQQSQNSIPQPTGQAPTQTSFPEATTNREVPSSAQQPASPPSLDTSHAGLGMAAGAVGVAGLAGAGLAAAPHVNVQAPTPTAPQPEDEDAIIADRTPEQQHRDEDIEMNDAGVSLPLSKDDVPGGSADADPTHARRESNGSNPRDLPPPPPLKERQAQVGNAQAVDNSASGSGSNIFAATPAPIAPSTHESQVSTPDQSQRWLLPAIKPELRGRKCLVLDLDETLVHSSFKILHQADFTIPVEIEGQYHNVYVIKRPGVDAFLKRVGEIYEVVVFTASVSKYGDPLLDILDISKSVHHRLFRESCYNHQGNYVKDLSQVGRPLEETIIIDNSPTSYIFHPQHAVPISSWFSDAHDNELVDLVPFLEDLAGDQVRDVSVVLDVAL
nr:hypothetical protein B0A51_09515 [Rachicladosporium sp. CCFEE 5018]